MDIFERASRAKLRFPSKNGALSTEQLWDLPLTTRTANKISLQSLGLEEEGKIKKTTESRFSFSGQAADPEQVQSQLRLDIISHICNSKLADKRAAETREMNKQELARRLENVNRALESKQAEAFSGMSEEELLAQREALLKN